MASFDFRTSWQNPLTRRVALASLLGGVSGLAGAAGFLALTRPHAPKKTADARPAPREIIAPALQSWPTLDATAQSLIDRKVTPGLSVAVARNGTLLYANAFGRARLEPSVAVTPQTGFRIASISKQFTAAAILLLQEAGKLSIDDPLSRYVPDFPRAADMTLRALLSHTSGLDDYLSGRHGDTLRAAQTHDYSGDELLGVLKTCDPMFCAEPGVKWAYSNTGFALLGIVIERVSGTNLAAFLHDRLLRPAGMTRTAIDSVKPGDSDLCKGYRATPRYPAGFGEVWGVSPSFAGGSGALRSVPQDLCRWHGALFGGQVLRPESLSAMLTPARLKDGRYAFDTRFGTPQGYGLGMRLGVGTHGPFFTHSGRINGFTGQLITYAAYGVTICQLSNCDGSSSEDFWDAQGDLRRQAFALAMG